MFYDRFIELCKKEKRSPSGLLTELGISRSSLTKWTNGATPKEPALNAIANYFNVSVDFLLDRKTKDDEYFERIYQLFSVMPDNQKEIAINILEQLQKSLKD